MAFGRPSGAYDRVVQRPRAVALVVHFREAEGLSIAQIADRLGRSPATIKAYFYDHGGEGPGGQGALRGRVPGCGAYTQPRNGKGDAYAYCKGCHPGAIAPTRTREWVRGAMRAWRQRYGRPPTSTDWSRTNARRRGGEPLKRLQSERWPSPSTVIDLYGTWAAAVADAYTDG